MKKWIKEAKKMHERGFFDENPKSALKLIAEIERLEIRIEELEDVLDFIGNKIRE
jgi:hypothetical protein